MANTVTITKLLDGPKHAIFHVYLASDGAAGELTDEVIIDPATAITPTASKLTIEEITYNLNGFDVRFEFDATADTVAWVLTQLTTAGKVCFQEYGGIKDRSGAGSTGKIQITTTGFTASGDQGTFIIKVRKD